jgi:hypothetical protein
LCGGGLQRTLGASATADAILSFLAYHSLVAITIELPDLASQTGFNLARWTEILADPDFAKLPDRIETDRHGRILMTPHPVFAILSAKVRLLLY